MRSNQRHLYSYGYNAGKRCEVFTPQNRLQLSEFIRSNDHQTCSLMGAGNSFGDVFLPADHMVLDASKLNRILDFDSVNGVIRVEGGAHVGELQQFLLQRGFYLPSCSGSINNTVAGDFSSNVNGKDSWKYGHYASNVESLVFLDSAGNEQSITASNEEVFNALAGGLGLIGIVVEITLRVKPICGSLLCVSRTKTGSLEETVGVLDEKCSEKNDFAYAWVDSLARCKQEGRAVVESAYFTEGEDSNTKDLKKLPTKVFGLPDDVFWTAYRCSWNLVQRMKLDRPLFRYVNSARYHLLQEANDQVKSYFQYQFPMMSTLPNWNKRFLKRGMQEIHCVFPKSVFVEANLELWKVMRAFGMYPELAAIRKHKADGGYLSFAADGFSTTLNYDRYGRTAEQLFEMERILIKTTMEFGGKVYLSKFPYLKQDEFESMYPNYDRFLVQKRRFDPENRLQTLTSQRLFAGLK